MYVKHFTPWRTYTISLLSPAIKLIFPMEILKNIYIYKEYKKLDVLLKF